MRAAHLNQNSVLGFIWHFAAKNKVLLFFIQIGALGFAIDNAIWPYFTGYLIDTLSAYKGSSGAIWDNLGYLFILAAVLEGVIILLYRLNGILLSYFFPKFEANIRMYMFEYVQNHSHKYFMNNLSGKIANKINDMPNSAYLIVEQLLNIYIPTFLAVSCSTIIFYYLSPSFASFLLGWVVVHLSIVVVTARKCHYQSLIHSESRSVVQGRILDNISNSAVVRVFARMKYELNFVKKYQKVEKDLYFRSLIFNEKIKIFQGLNHFAFFIFIGFLVIEDFRNEIISVGELVLILSSFLNISFMVWYTGIELPFFIRQIGICSQALSVIRDVHDIEDKKDAKILKVKKGKIEFKDVSFHFDKGNKLFQNKNLVIEPGQTLGLVGYSGSGKSTIINLLLRNFEVESGKILIDGQNIQDVTQESLRDNIAFIPQDSSLFHRSILENIHYGNLNATTKEVYEAAEKAHCDFIDYLPGAYDYIVGEKGTKLSGGQRQRISIARAILKDAPILILDEATSALDSQTEKKIQDALEFLMKDKTTLIVAHRLSTLSGVDKIIVFDNGKIVEQGTHKELLKHKGHYYRMWKGQMGGFLPDE